MTTNLQFKSPAIRSDCTGKTDIALARRARAYLQRDANSVSNQEISRAKQRLKAKTNPCLRPRWASLEPT